MPGLKVLGYRGVPLQCGGRSPLDLEDAPVTCLETERLRGGTVPTGPSRVHIPLSQSGVPTLLLG
eukprot:1040215-Amphidinium_carterae.1